jgi:exodeoxyribonuclease VII small subunit
MAKKLSFEEGMAELTSLVEAMEGGQLTLEESFEAYERGAALAARLKELLDKGDRRIAALTDSLKEIDISGEVAE